MYKKPVLIAEVGCNHMGDVKIAKKFIKTAKEFCNLKYIKFQKRNIKELLSEKQYNAPHPVFGNSFGNTYGLHREFLEFDIKVHEELKKYCENLDINYSSSVWDITSAEEICALNPSHIKIPSATNTNFELLGYLCDNYRGMIHISLGMTAKKEENEIVEFFEQKKREKNLILYSCTSGYPVPPRDVCLLEISRLKKLYGNRIKDIGFSGHHNGIALDIGAYSLGANYIERHFTLDRTWKGTDHAASLEPDGMRRLNRDLNNLYMAMKLKSKDILDIEKPQRKKLKWES